MTAPVMPPPGFDELSVDDQVDYVQSLWRRITEREHEVPVPDWHREVVRERLAALDADAPRKTWDEFRSELREQLRAVRG